ncbi:MAG: MerR family transcriptional regulator [Desulfobacteraceae bacterium]|nr:MerR family transcriptional regulator [Desulfobacteraceae bacterium]
MLTCFISEAAKKIGVAPITLKRWLLAGKVTAAKDRNNYWVFDETDIKRIKAWADKRTYPNTGRGGK